MEKVGRINRRQGFIVGEYWLRFISPPPRLRQEMERLLNCYAIRQTNNPPCIPFVSRTVYTGVLHNSGSLSRTLLLDIRISRFFPRGRKKKSPRLQFSIDYTSNFFSTIFLRILQYKNTSSVSEMYHVTVEKKKENKIFFFYARFFFFFASLNW